MRSLIFVLLATGVIAAPLSSEREKAARCDTKSNRFHSSKEFPYNYEGETVSTIAGASSARSGLKIRARCVIKAVASCEHVLKLDTVELWEAQSKNPGPLRYRISQGSTAFAEELEAQDLVFRTDRGRITELLAHPEEPSHVLNIKRGILSALQVQFVDSRATLVEDDVVGKCKAHYEIKSRHLSGRPKVIYKTRNLTECTDRAQTDIGIHVHSYEEKPLSLLNSHSTCKVYLTAKTRTQKVVCEEQHIFRPFSAGFKNASGAITTTRQVLELQSIKPVEPETVPLEGFRTVSLKYAHAVPQSNQEGIRDAFYLVLRLSQDSRKSTKPDSAQHFSELVFSIRKLNSQAMETLWQKVHQEEDQKMHEYFYDALPHCGTGGCAKVMSRAIRNNLVSHERGNMFLAGLALAANPSKETIAHVLELCEDNPGRTAMLTLGTLIYKVCESSPQQCDSKDKHNPITRAENFFLSRLGARCEGSSPEEFENILVTLKAIGNAGRPLSAENVLLKCTLNLDAPVNMSIAALEALRRLPCNNEMAENLLAIYGNHDLDVEIRIAAYLALMKCPSPEIFRRVAEILKNEVNNQVGSFVWSHMTNAMESTEPVHGKPQAEIMKDALNGMKLREFNLNRLRFSRAWEGSFYNDVLRFGGSAQSHLIYHPSSFFPRSAMFNVTVDVLGASINVLETGARFEGVEVLIEQFFGDDGYLPDDRIMKMFNLKPHEERDKEEKTVNKALRGKRSLGIKDDINKVEKHLNKLHRTMDIRKHHPSGAVSVKMFGNELRLASFDDISWLNDEIDKVNMIDFLLMLAKGGSKTISKSMMFLDAQTTVPTILGLPLKLSAKGTTVAAVELAGKFDIRNMFWGKMSFDVRGHVKPSAVVDISGRMGVSAVHAEAGILVNSSLYTVTSIKGNATYSQGEILKFEIGVPEDPVQFVNVSSSLYTTLNDEKLAIEGTPRRIEPSPCLNMTRLLGLRFCGQLSIPLSYRDLNAPFFPLSGPASYSISMQRTDPKLTKYQLLIERMQTEDENEYDIIAKMSTPGATWERNFDASATLWFKEDGKLFTVSTGALGVSFGKFEATYNNMTHALNLTYSAKDAIYGYPIVLNGHFFNNTEESLSRDLGIQLSASYRNYTIKQLTKLYKKAGVYGFANNITYWPGKYLYAAGELNIPKKSIDFVANHTCTKTEIKFNGNLGDEENNFIFSFNNEPTKAGIDLTGRYLKSQKEGVLRLFARPCEQSFTLRGFYAESGNEKGIRFTASHDNKNRLVSWYTGIVNSTNEKSLKANATVLGRKAEAVLGYFNFTQKKGVKFNGLLLNKTIGATWAYVNVGHEKGLTFNATGFNKTMEAAWTLLNFSTGKSLKFNASVVNKTIDAVWSYVNFGKEKGLRMNASAMNYTMQSALVLRTFPDATSVTLDATALNKTAKAMWSYFNAGTEKGICFNVTGLNRTAEVMWSYFNFGRQRGIRFNASALNRTMDATWTFLNLTNEKGLKFHARALNKTVDATWSILNSANEKSMKFNASAVNKTLDAKWTFLNLTNEKGLKFQASTLNKTIDATWSILNLPSEKSLKFNASAINKTIEAKWSFLNLTNEKGLKFQGSALNKTIDATWSFLNLTTEKSMKFNASALNKTFDAKWSFLNLANEKSLKFEARALNKTINASWSFLNLGREKKSLLFKASVLNKTINATWVVLNLEKEKSLLFKANVLNKTVETALTIVNLTNEKGLEFSAKVQNKTIDATWTFISLTDEKSLKFRASVLNKSIESSWSFLNFPNEKGIKFNLSSLNKTIDVAWTFINLTNEKLIKFNATGCNRSAEVVWSYLKGKNGPSIKFNASAMNKTVEAVMSYSKNEYERTIKIKGSAMNKTMEAVWSYLRKDYERSIKFNASALNKTVETIWKYVTKENEKSLKFKAAAVNKTVEVVLSYLMDEKERAIVFNASAMNKTIEAVWSYVKRENEKSLKFKASAMKETIETTLGYLTNENERAIKFNASAINKTVEAIWSYIEEENKMDIKFNASAMNKTVEAVWSYMKQEDQKSLKFKASAMNKSIEATWAYLKSENGRSIKFSGSAINKTVEAMWSYLKTENGRSIKFNASAVNKTVEATWTYLQRENERAIKFSSFAMNKTVEATWSYLKTEHGRSIKFNASSVNKTVEATWTYLQSENERAIKFSSSAMNKTVEAVWSYLKTENGRSIKFNASAVNKTVEATWTLLNTNAKKGLQFNLAVINKTMNSSLVYFTEPTNMGLRLNISCCNQSFELESRIVFQEKKRKLVITAAYQNYTVALVGLFQNLTTQKSACLYPEYLGRSHGKICAFFTNSSTEKSMSLNVNVLNRTGELKTQWFKNRVECANRLTAKFNRTTFLESWLSFFHTTELKSLHVNTTVVNKSVSASLYFRNMTEKAIGFNATALKKRIGVKGTWLNGKTVREAVVLLFWNHNVVAKSALTLLNNTQRKMIEFRYHIGRFAAEWQATFITQSESVNELIMVRMLRNGSQSLFFDSSKLILSKEERSSSLGFQYNVRLMGLAYECGWDAAYNNYSSAEDSYHETRLSFIYSKGKMVSLTGAHRNNSEELSSVVTVEYLPEKTLTHSLTWFKKSKSVRVKLELLPRTPITWTTSWETKDGISIESTVESLNKKIENWFTYSKSTGEYSGHFEICPVYPVTVKGLLIRENGLLFTTEIGAFKRTWNHKIDFRKDEQKLLVSVDVLPNAPVVFDASWDTSEGMQIAMDLKGFKKSLQLVYSYDRLTNTFKSGVTMLKRTLIFTEKLDVETKTLFLTLVAFNRTVGFTGRFDWKNYIVSTFVKYQNNQAGWFLRFNPASRNIVFNVTLTPRISGQVVGEMPDDQRLQVTLQRKFGMSVVNESRLVYLLNSEASRVSLTWNTTSVNTLVGKVRSLKTFIANVTLKCYNLTLQKAKNMTKEIDAIVKKLDAKIRPYALKLYVQMNNYDYQRLFQNGTKMAQNITQRLYNITIKGLNDTMKHLITVMPNATALYKYILGNATELYKSIRRNATEAYQRFRKEVLPPIIGNVTLHLKNISRDLNVWAKNVSVMLSAVSFRAEKLGDIARSVSVRVKEITADLIKKVDLKTRELIIKLREIEIREQNVGLLFDEYMLKVKDFTCGFNVSCTLKNLTIVAKNLTLSVRNITLFNKTIKEHFKLLNETVHLHFKQFNKTLRQQLKELHKKACAIHQRAVNFTRNLTRILPKLLRNATIQVIHLVKNVSSEVRTIAIKVRKVTLTTYAKLVNTHRPLINLTTKALLSLKGKAYPLLIEIVQPIRKLAVELSSNVTRYLKPIVIPLVPMALDMMYQLRNITIRHIPIGNAMDKALVISLKFASQALRSVKHTLSSNITAVVNIIYENAKRSPEEIVNLAIKKSILFFNATKKVLNQSLHFNLSAHASLVYNKSITALNKTLQELLKLRPNELLEMSIKRIQVIGKNITAEVLRVTKQLRALDLIRPVKSAWAEMDLKVKIDALKLDEKWENLVQRIRGFNIKQRALLLKYYIGNATLKVQKELKDLFNLTQRVLILTSNLVRSNISKEEFIEEFIAIGNETRRFFIKYGVLAKTITLDWERNLRKLSFEAVVLYKNITVNKTIEVYKFLKKHSQEFYSQHRDEGVAVYNYYTDMAKEIYEELKEKAIEDVYIYREKLTNKVKELVSKVRQYENMTYEEIAVKAYEFSSHHGLAVYNKVTLRAVMLYKNLTIGAMKLYNNITIQGLQLYKNISLRYKNLTIRAIALYKNITARGIQLYKNITTRGIQLYKNITTRGIQLYKNVTLRALELFNDTKNATLRAYNFTLVLVNRSKVLAVRYINVTRNLTLHYYNVTRNYTLQYYNFTRSLALRYYHKYYNLSRNYTLHIYKVTRNITLGGFNKTRALVLRGVRYLGYLNKTVMPKIKECFLKGRVLVLRYVNQTVVFVRGAVYTVKVWYHENKEKTLEELYFEVYELAERKSIKAKEFLERKYYETKEQVQEKIKAKLNEVQSKFNVKLEEWKKELQKLNRTLMNITGEAISVYNQTANITYIAAKELAAIVHPYVKFMHNKTVFYLVKAKNISLPLLDKAINITLLKLSEGRVLVNETYVKFMARRDVQEFIQKYHLKERYAEAEMLAREKYEEVVEYIKEIRPKVEARIKRAIEYVNVTLQSRIKERFTLIQERYNMIHKKYARIVANPRMFIERVLKKVLRYLRNATKGTQIEQYLYSEMWVELIEEVKGHELVEVGRNFTNYTTSNVRLALELASKNGKLLFETIKTHTVSLKEKVKAKAQDTREKMIQQFEGLKVMKLREIVEHEYVFKTIELAKNVTLQVHNVTLQARNLTRKIVAIGKLYYKNITAKVQNYTLLFKEKFNNYTKVLQQRVQNFTKILNETLRNYTKILNETVHNYTKIIRTTVQNYTNFLNATVQNYTRILNATVQNYTRILNATVQKYTRIVNASLHMYTKILNASLQNYTKILNASIHNCTNILRAKVQNYTKMIKEQFRNYTLILSGHYERIYQSHFLPLYRNGTVLVHKYKALAERCIGRCKNVTFKAFALARNWTMVKVNLSRVWINQTIERGMKYYNDELKPLYYSKVLPFYNLTLLPMYRNYSKLLISLKKNVTLQVISMKERTINLTRQAVDITLNSQQYAMLRKVGKMTIRETVLEGRKMYIQAYNYTLNMTRTIVNVTLTRFNITKDCLERAINKTMLAVNTTLMEAEPVIAFLNATRVEVMETAIFLGKYSGLEDAVRERVRRCINTARNATLNFVNNRVPVFCKTSAMKALDVVNSTIRHANRFVNRTIVYLNATFVNVTRKLNLTTHIIAINQTIHKTIQDARAVFNKTINTACISIQKVRVAINSTIEKALISLENVHVVINNTIVKARIFSIHQIRVAINNTMENARIYLENVRVAINSTIAKARLLSIQKLDDAINSTIAKARIFSIQEVRVAINNTIEKARIYLENVRVAINSTIAKARVLSIQQVRVAINRTIEKARIYLENVRVAINNTIAKARLISTEKVRVAIDDTIEKALISLENVRITINKTITAIPKYIQVTEGGITFVIPHPRSFDGNIKTLAIATVQRFKNLPQEALAKIEALKQTIIDKIRSLKRDVVIKIKSLKINLKDLKVQALEKITFLKGQAIDKIKFLKGQAIDKIKSLKVQALDKIKSLKQEAFEKIETLKREVVIKMQSLKREALIKVETFKQNAVKKFGQLKVKARNLTVRVKTIGKAWVAVAMNRTVLYRQKAYGFVMKAYNLTKNHPVTGTYLNITLQYINITKDLAVFYRKNGYAFVVNVYNLTKNHPLIRKYVNLTLHYFNITKELAISYHNKTLRFAKRYYNLTKNHPLVVKYTNVTVRYLNITKNFVRGLNLTQIKNVTEKYLLRALNLSRQYLNMTQIKNVTQRYMSQALNLSRRSVLFNQVRNVTYKILNMTRQSTFMIRLRNVTYKFLNMSRQCPFLTVPKNVTLKYLFRALNLSRYCLNITEKYLSQALNLSRHWYRIGVNTTLNYSIQVYRVAENVTLNIYNSSCLVEAFGKTRNYSKIAFNVTTKLSKIAINKTLTLYKNYSTMALKKTLHLYRNTLARARNLSALVVNETIKLYRCMYNKTMVIVYNSTLVKQYIPIVKKYVPIALNATRNFTVQAYNVVVNVTLDIYNSSCLVEAFGKTRNYSKIALNVTMKLYRVALLQAKNFSTIALNKTVTLFKNYSTIVLNKTVSFYREALAKSRNFSSIAFNKTIKLCRRLCNTTMVIVYNTPLARKYLPVVQKYVPVVLNATRNFTVRAYKLVVNVTLDIYNSSCLMEAYNKTRNYSKIAFNATVKLCEVALLRARNYSTIALNKTLALYKNYSAVALNKTLKLYREALIKAKNYSMTVYNKTLKVCQRVYNKTALVIYNTTLVKKYIPMAFNFSRYWCSVGYNATRNFTLQAYNYAVNVTLDIYHSENLTQALFKFRNYSRNTYIQTVRFCRKLYRQVYNATLHRYSELCNQSVAFYKQIVYNEITVKCINKARSYLDLTKKMVKMRLRNLHRAKGHLQKRVNHQMNRMSHLLNPINWIPPFNSTAMIFGGPHVYTFDGTYYAFPGYKKTSCMYVLARDVRDNKFTILSQETAIIVVTEDSSVKIHQDGRVETIVKVASSGKKISDGYHSELPVESFNTTVQREGSFILLRHDLGLEIVCDVEHYLCTFNIAKWFHGRMAGLLGTNNNEFHDEFMASNNKQTKDLLEFVNSWEITRDPECKIMTLYNEKPKCKESSYVQRCRTLFKDKESPLHRFASIVNPEPFVKACELDYKECDMSTPKDMRHCNTTAAYIELVRLRGEWAEYLPECGRCGSNQIGQRWFQRADRKVDVVVLVHETSVLKSYAAKLPTFLNSITEALDQSKYSFKFGVMAYGGRLLHSRPHPITLDGQLMNDLPSVESAFEHLRFAGEESENDTSDALEAMASAAYVYPFRPAATKIFLLLTSTERSAFANAISVDSIGKLLETKDITLNVIGKYRKFRGEIVGQDFRGKVFYRKKPEIGTGVAPLPEGEYMALMRGTQGSVFGLPFLGSENKDKFGALQQASVSTWREQIKRDQFTCKECFCARGDAGQGKTICKVNSYHQKC